MSSSRAQLAAEIAEASRELHRRGWVANHDGNVSVRLDADRFLVTPTAVSKAVVVAEGLAVTDASGKVAEGTLRPPSEFALHLGAYGVRPDIAAVVHAHPPYATAMACAGRGITTFLPEAVVSLGPEIPVTRFALPFGEEGAAPIAELIPRHDALLLCRHGVITVGPNVELALLRMELVEHLARIETLAAAHGGVRSLPDDVLEPLIEKRRKAGLGLAAERTGRPGSLPPGPLGPTGGRVEPTDAPGSAAESSSSGSPPPPSSWTPAGPPPARDAWSGGATEGACGVVYGAVQGAAAEGAPEVSLSADLEDEVRAAIERHLVSS